jgi:hypothetical protein
VPGSYNGIGTLQYSLILLLIVFYQVERVEVFRVQAMSLQNLLGEVTLQRRKPQVSTLIMPQQELDQPIAQPANTVVENDRIRTVHHGFSKA